MEMLSAIFWLAGAIFFFVGLIMMLTVRRKWVMNAANGSPLVYLALLICTVAFICGCLYFALKYYDFETAMEVKNFYRNSFELNYFVSGAICLIVTYAYAKIDDSKLPEKYRGKKTWVIIFGILFGLAVIYLGIQKLHGG